ncbi:MAG: hypothetical protein ACNI25_04285 [Halarcobacter sp.]
MKKITTSLLLATTLCFSSVSYDESLNYFKNKEYKKSFEGFNELFNKNSDDTLINFYLGRSAFELGLYEIALSAYDRVLIKEPENIRVRLEIAHTNMKLGNYDESIKEFELALKSNMPNQVRNRVLQNIEFMKQKQQKHFFNVTTMFGIMYDSNIDITPDANSFDIYVPALNTTVTLNNTNKKGSTIYQMLGAFSYKYKFNDNWILDNNLTALQMKYINHKDKDLGVISTSVIPSYYANKYKVGLGFLFDKVLLGHKTYQNNYYFNPTYTRVLDESILYETGIKYGRINYKQDDTRSSNLLSITNNIKYQTQDYGLFSFDLNLGKEYKVKSGRTDVEYKFVETGISNSYDLINAYTLTSSFKYKKSMYEDTDINFLSKRDDDKIDLSLGVQKALNKNMFINFGGTFTDNNSNHATSDYDKYTIKTNLFYSF